MGWLGCFEEVEENAKGHGGDRSRTLASVMEPSSAIYTTSHEAQLSRIRYLPLFLCGICPAAWPARAYQGSNKRVGRWGHTARPKPDSALRFKEQLTVPPAIILAMLPGGVGALFDVQLFT